MALGEKALESTLLIEEVVHQLHKYLQSCDYAGYDPYDGLESRIFQALPFKRFRITRLAWIQLMKRSPLNLRPLVLVPQSRNPKGIALCAAALLKLGQGGKSDYEKEARVLLDWLITHQTRGYEGASWGYNFSWHSYQGHQKKLRAWGQDKGHKNEMEIFVDSILNGKPFPMPFEQIVLSMMTTFKAVESLRTGRPIEVGFK
jgi:hypothetical protein